MGVYIEKREYRPEANQYIPSVPPNTTDNTSYLKGNIFQKINFTGVFRIETWVTLSTNRTVWAADANFKTTDWITDLSRGNAFEEFNVGDVIKFTGTNQGYGSFLIREKLNDASIRVYSPAGGVPSLPAGQISTGRMNLVQIPKGISFDFGLPENDDATTFTSKVDGNLMRYEFGVLSTWPTGGFPPVPLSNTMEAVGRKSWQTGEAVVTNITEGVDQDNDRYIFKIEQQFFINPYYLDNQLIDLLANTPPDYFNLGNCLKHNFRLRAYRSLQNPNIYQEGVFDDKIGNTGWFNEEYNGSNKDFSVSDLSYNNSINTINRFAVNKANPADETPTTITFQIDSIPNVLGVSALIDFVTLNFIMLPEDSLDYQNINTLMKDNYCFDRAVFDVISGVPVNGERFGTDFQVFEDFSMTINGTQTQATCSVKILFGADVLAKIDSYKDKYFLLAASVNSKLDPELANYTCLKLDVNQIKVLIPDDVLTVTNNTIFHDQNSNYNNLNPVIKVEDEIVMDSLVMLNQSVFTDLQIEQVNLQIVAKKTGEEAVIMGEQFNFGQLPNVGTVKFINQVSQNALNVNPAEIRKEIKAYRNIAQDSGSEFAYRFQYPFMYRWEYWEQLNLVNLPADWLDASQQFNGYNNNWVRLAAFTGWDIYYRLAIEVSAQNTLKTINTDFVMDVKGYDSNSDWSTPVVKIFDGANNLEVGGIPYMLDSRNTTVKISFTYTGSSLPATASDVFMVGRIIPKENGTYITSESYSSVWNRSAVSLFTSANGLISVTKVGSVFTGEFDVDYSKLPIGVREFTISGSISENNP